LASHQDHYVFLDESFVFNSPSSEEGEEEIWVNFSHVQHQLHEEIYLACSTANGSFGVSGDQYVYEWSRHIAVKMPLGLMVRVTEQVRVCK